MKFKTAEEWAQEYMETEEYKIDRIQMDNEFRDFIVYGEPTTWRDDVVLTELLPMEVIIERYNLTDKQIEDLHKLRKL